MISNLQREAEEEEEGKNKSLHQLRKEREADREEKIQVKHFIIFLGDIFIMPTPIIAHKETNFPIKVLKKRHYALMRLKMAPKPLSGGERMLTQEKKIHIF